MGELAGRLPEPVALPAGTGWTTEGKEDWAADCDKSKQMNYTFVP